MPPSDKNKTNSEASEDSQREEDCSKPVTMDNQAPSDPATSSAPNQALPDHGTITSIPVFTANINIPTLKCSINDQMKTFDPGEVSSNERLSNSNCNNNNQSGSSIVFPVKCGNSLINKNSNKNYKAGSKINKLADMLAKRSQNIVEVTSDIKNDFNVLKTNENDSEPQEVNDLGPKTEDAKDSDKTVNDKPVDLVQKSRRKSVPNHSCTVSEPLQLQSNNSKSCSDISELFTKNEENALEEPLDIKPQTDGSTKNKKVIKKNLKNVELSLILPEKKRRSSPRNKKVSENSQQAPKLVIKDAKPTKLRKSKRLVETSTQTADIEFISLVVDKAEKEAEGEPLYACLYCSETFATGPDCKSHEKTHGIKKKSKQLIKCQFCSKKVPSLNEIKSHCIKSHSNKYFICIKCDERFHEKDQLNSHNKEVHPTDDEDKTKQKQSDLKIDVSFDSAKKSSTSPRILPKSSPRESKTEEQLLEAEMLFYSHLSGNIQENLANHLDGKIDKNGNPVRTDQIADSQDLGNLLSVAPPNPGVPVIQISRAPSPYQTRSKTPNPLPPTAKKFKKLPNWQQKFWEKYNFPTNYRFEHRFWDKNYLEAEKSPLYLKDLSCLDIKTQLTMRENIKKLDSIKATEETAKTQDRLTFPDYLSLIPKVHDNNNDNNKPVKSNVEYGRGRRIKDVKKSFKSPGGELPVKNRKINAEARKQPEKSSARIADGLKMMTRRQSSVDLGKEEKKTEESGRRRKGSLDMTSGQKMVLRRQTSLDNLQGSSKTDDDTNVVENNDSEIVGSDSEDSSQTLSAGTAEISGEWVRPRSYLCGTCCLRFTNLWELEDHKWTSHPNVWCTHYEFEDEKIDKLFNKSDEDDSSPDGSSAFTKHKLTDLYKRYLLPHGFLKTAKLIPNTNFPEQCTKCKKHCGNSSELHKHMLDCGGDTTWFLTMYSSPTTMKRKWRPFGSRRRKQIGRRMVKRNIPSTPTLRPYQYQHRIRTKPGDVETIQKMLANLPEKRARRAINFDEIKTRSQATIHSNRLLRKRFKVSFGSNFMRLKNLKAQQRLKPVKKESSSKSNTDTSSESTPIGSPKRKRRETTVLPKPEAIVETIETIAVKEEEQSKPTKKKPAPNPKNNKKVSAKKKPSSKPNSKPATRSNTQETAVEDKKKAKKKPLKKPPPKIKKESKPAEEIEKQPVEEKEKEKIKEVSGDNNLNVKKQSILRLRQNDKEKTELIKKIKKKLNNSKRILGSKQKPEMRRSERIKTLQEIPEIPNGVAENKEEVIEPVTESLPVEQQEPVKKSPKRKVDLSEMPILDKEEPLKGRSVRKNEPEIPILMPFENGSEEAKDSLKFKIVSKKRKTPDEKVTPLKIVKEAEESTNTKKRKIETKTSKSKKHFLGIGPNEIDKGGEKEIQREKEDSESDSEPLITLVSSKKVEEPEAKSKKPEDLEVKAEVEEPEVKSATVEEPVSKPKEVEETEVNSIIVEEPEIKSKAIDEPEVKSKKIEDSEVIPITVQDPQIKFKKAEDKEVKTKKNDDPEIKSKKMQDKEVKWKKIEEPEVKSKKIEDNQMKLKKVKDPKPKSKKLQNKEVKSKKVEARKLKPKKIEEKELKSKKNEEPEIKSKIVVEPEIISKVVAEPEIKSKMIVEPEIKSKITVAQEVKSKVTEEQVVKSKVTVEPVVKSKVTVEPVVKSKITVEPEIKLKKVEDQSAKLKKIESPEVKLKKMEEPEIRLKKIEAAEIKPKKFEIPEIKSKKPEKPLIAPKPKKIKSKPPKKPLKRLKMKVTLKEPTLKIPDKSPPIPSENKWTLKPSEEPEPEPVIPAPERRSRRISKEIKSSNEFVIDDPLILVDELWSELDSDSDSSKKRTKKGKKKTPKKKAKSEVDLEKLLRNFGEKKENQKMVKRIRKMPTNEELRQKLQQQKTPNPKSFKNLSLRLFRFNKKRKNLGNQGIILLNAIKDSSSGEKRDVTPGIPFLASEITENPVQIIQCGRQKSKRKNFKKTVKNNSAVIEKFNLQFKISVPLESINNLAVLNNNHLTEVVVEEPPPQVSEEPPPPPPPPLQPPEITESNPTESEILPKTRRSEVIDKIFYCEICKTYYYSSSQLKNHKMSNRHKQKELEFNSAEPQPPTEQESKSVEEAEPKPPAEPMPEVINGVVEPSQLEIVPEIDKSNEDTSEMPILEGPFIENPFVRLGMERMEPAPKPPPPPAPAPSNPFGFSEDCLKDIQKAIGCTDEEMLILTLLGENSIEIENDILDLDSCQPVNKSSQGNDLTDKPQDETQKESEKSNGILKIDLKKRMTSALACLVNKAVFNLLQKSGSANKAGVNPEALSFLNKLSSVSHKKNILQLNELLKKQSFGESSVGSLLKDDDKSNQRIPYKYQCTICGSRFEKASTRECHIIRTHRAKSKKTEEVQVTQTPYEEEHSDWNDTWSYDGNDDALPSQRSQFWCSDCGINFHSPQEVLEHQKLEHQTTKDSEQVNESGPLQSSTIGSSDEIVEGKKPPPKRRSKHFSTAELDQQRIIANNELRKLDRKFSNKNKPNKAKWGMDALKFTVEKENKSVENKIVEEKIPEAIEEPKAPPIVDKNLDIVPKLNLSKTNNIPEFKVIQKNKLENRFQKIIDNKIKRKSTKNDLEVEEPEVIKKPEKKKRNNTKGNGKKIEERKVYDVYDFNDSESETEPIILSHVKKTPQKKVKEGNEPSKNKADSTTKDLAPDDYDSEDSLPLAVVKKGKEGEEEEDDDEGQKSEGILEQVEYLIEQLEGEDDKEKKKETESFRISLENKFLQLDNIPLKNKKDGEKVSDEEDSLPLKVVKEKAKESESMPELLSCKSPFKASEESLPPLLPNEFDNLNGNVIYRRNSVSDFESDLSNDGLIDSEQSLIQEVTEKEDVVIVCSKKDEEEEKTNGKRKRASVDSSQKKKKIIPLLSATIEEDNFRKSESPKLNKEVIVKKIWSRKKTENEEQITENDDQTEIEKEMIMKKIWSRKKLEEGEKKPETPENVKINQTEISDEVVIKCGPKTKTRRKSKASNESSKETIMRRIWSGKCTFQTKAALKTYETDIVSKEDEEVDSTQTTKRKRQASLSNSNKRMKTDDERSEDEDDLDSLLEEIEREDLEKAIRLEFLQLRRSDKNPEISKEITEVGLFAETCLTESKEISDKKRRKVRKSPTKRIIRRKVIKKPTKKALAVVDEKSDETPPASDAAMASNDAASDISEASLEKNSEAELESKIKSHKHKKHRHKHHHHKHKHKKSKHHKSDDNKHKNKHKLENGESLSMWEKICQDLPEDIKNEPIIKPRTSKLNDVLINPPFSIDDDDVKFSEEEKKSEENESGNVYEFIDEDSEFSLIRKKNHKK